MADKMIIMKIQGKDIINNDSREMKLPIYRVPKEENSPHTLYDVKIEVSRVQIQ